MLSAASSTVPPFRSTSCKSWPRTRRTCPRQSRPSGPSTVRPCAGVSSRSATATTRSTTDASCTKDIDLAANIGNNVYATGDATVQSTDLGQPRRGYGKQILLNHQYGYQTRYAHLSQIFVKPGEKVVRGQLIGKVGNTGGVTGPHLHYEVIHMGQVVNPINYFNRNMTNEEYERLMEQMQELNLDTFDE